MKQVFKSALSTLAMLAMAVVAAAPSEAKTTIKFALSVPDTPLATVQGLKAFKAYVESRSNGEIEVRTFFASLGGERELVEQVRQGTLEMTMVADGALAGFYKPVQVFAVPYLFPSSPVAWEFFRHPFAKRLADEMRGKTGIRTVALAENGFRNFTNSSREIKTPDDMKGLKIRTMESPVFIRFVQALGASATPMSFSELVLALKQKVVDGQENATPDIYENGMADVQKFLSVNEHIYSINFIVGNDRFLSALPEAQQRLVAEGAQLMSVLINARKNELHAEYLDKIKAKGLKVHVTTPQEKEQFRKLSQEPVKEYIASQVGAPLVAELLAAVEDSSKVVYGR